jgi:hypothetical protein
MNANFVAGSAILLITSCALSAHAQPDEGTLGKAAEQPTRCTTYTRDDGTVYCVLCTKGLNWTESAKEEGSRAVISDVVGRAGVGASKDEAGTNLSDVKTGTGASGKTIVYFQQQKAFKNVNLFHLDLQRGRQLTYESLEDIGFP